MSRVEIVCMSEVRPSLVQLLQEQGLVHLEDVPLQVETESGVETSELVAKMDLKGDELVALGHYEDMERTLQEILPLLTDAPSREAVKSAQSSLQGLSSGEFSTRISTWADRLRQNTREKLKLQDTVAVLTNYQAIIEQVAPVLARDVKLGKGSRAIVLNGNVDPVLERLQQRFRDDIGSGSAFHFNRTSKRSVVGLVTFPEDRGDDVSRILSQEGVAPVDVRDDSMHEATASEVLTQLRTTLQRHHSRLGELNLALADVSREAAASLHAAKTIIADELNRLRVQRTFGQTQMLTVMHGWVPEDRLGDLRHAVNESFHGRVTVSELDHHDVPHYKIPTQLRNPAFFQPFELVLKLFNPPTYGSMDPTILVGLSFTLFYGFIVGDVLYGAAIAAFAIWLTNKFKHIPAMADVRKIGIYMGVSSMFFGVLYGEYGGEWTGIPYIWMHRTPNDPIDLMIWSLYFGMGHIILAMSLAIYENWRHHHLAHAMEKAGMLLGLLALIIVAYAYFDTAPFNSTPMLTLAGLMFGVGAVLIFRAMGVMGLIGILEIMSLGGNVISYARLMALGVAAVAIAGIANELPETLGPVIGIPAAILIHIVNIGISIASPTIHAMRLNVVEFLPKFFHPDGRGYAPFKKETQS